MPHLHLTNREWESTEYCENQLMNASRDHNEFCQYWKLVFEEMVAIDDGREADHHLRPRQPIRGPTNQRPNQRKLNYSLLLFFILCLVTLFFPFRSRGTLSSRTLFSSYSLSLLLLWWTGRRTGQRRFEGPQ